MLSQLFAFLILLSAGAPAQAAMSLGPITLSPSLSMDFDLRGGGVSVTPEILRGARDLRISIARPSLSAATPSKPEFADPRASKTQYLKIVKDSPSNLKGLTVLQRSWMWMKSFAHKIAGVDDPRKLAIYDPLGIIGFCFGRSMTGHLLARQMGLPEDRIKNLFVIGDLRSGDTPEWRFHVSTLVLGDDGVWYAIDPILNNAMTAKAWIARVRSIWDKAHKAKFYLTPASTVIPEIGTVPTKPEEESGERVIELSFDPSTKEGFAAVPELGSGVYQPDARRLARHFRGAERPASPFGFLGIDINGDHYSYNNYFVDLLQEFTTPSPTAPRKSLGAAGPAAAASGAPRALGLNFGKLPSKSKE